MIQLKIFQGTIEEIELAFNVWARGLAQVSTLNSGQLTHVEGDQWIKEVVYQIAPAAPSNGIVPVPRMPSKMKPN